MKQDLFEKTKAYIESCNPIEAEQLLSYLNNSDNFTLHREKRGVEIIPNLDTITFVDAKEDKRNYYWEYLSLDNKFIVRIDKYVIREGLLKPEAKLFLEHTECPETEVPVYRISCK